MFEKLIQAVKQAGDFIKQGHFISEQKDGFANIVTQADLWSQNFLCEQISKHYENAGFICEEEHLLKENKNGLTFVIDPIDGTQNFSRGIGEYAISVGVLDKGEVIFGVVYNPAKDELYVAEKGKGAYLNGKKISVSKRKLNDALFCTALSLYKKDYAEVCAKIILDIYKRSNDVRRFGSCALELCYLAKGDCDLFFEMRVFPWDYCASFLILKEAGGEICGYGGQKCSFNKPTMILASNCKESLQELINTVNKYLDKVPYEE